MSNNPELDTENTDVAILTSLTTASRMSSPTTGTVERHFSTPTFFPVTPTHRCDEIDADRRPAEIQPRVDTLVAVMIGEDIDRKEGWQYIGVIIYDMKIPNTRPRLHPPLIGRIIAEHRAVDVMSN